MRVLILACGAALALAACSSNKGNEQANADMNDMNATDPNAANMMMTQDNGDMANSAGGADMNSATNSTTENAMAKDMNTNDKDTNLSNGM